MYYRIQTSCIVRYEVMKIFTQYKYGPSEAKIICIQYARKDKAGSYCIANGRMLVHSN